MASELRRLGWVPALGVLVGGVIAAFGSLQAFGADSSARPRQVKVEVTPAAAREPVAKPRPRPQLVEPVAGVRDAAQKQSAQKRQSAASPARPAPARPSPSRLRRAVGRKIMTGFGGSAPSAALLSRVRRGEVGGVILFTANIGPNLRQAIDDLQRAARAGGNLPLLIATDQEGGEVKRITTAPPSHAPAQMTTATAAGEGTATGVALQSLGINTNLAPVADVNHDSFLGNRSFGSDPGQVAGAACQFAQGLESVGVNATLKHFPGLGRTTQNTDLHQVSVGAGQQALQADLAPYRRCAGTTSMVMLSNATYPALDSNSPAVFSTAIIHDLLRGQIGFDGVTISDTLGAPGIASSSTAVRASRAGVDMLLYIDEGVSALAYRKLLAAVHDGQLPRASVLASAARIRALAR